MARSCISDEISVGVVQVIVSKSLIASATIRALVEVQDVLTNRQKPDKNMKINMVRTLNQFVENRFLNGGRHGFIPDDSDGNSSARITDAAPYQTANQ